MGQTSRYKYELALLSVILVWGVNFPVIKWALEVMHPHVVNAFRFAVSTLVLGALYWYQRRGKPGGLFGPVRRFGFQLAGLGLLGYFFYQMAFILGIDLTTSGNAALIMAAAPLWTALLSSLLGYDRLVPLAWVALFISLGGTVLVILAGSPQVGMQVGSMTGNLLMLLASLLWGAYTALNRSMLDDVTSTELTFLGLLFSLPLLFGVSIPYFPSVVWSEVGVWVWGAIVFSGGLSVGLVVVIWNAAVKNVGPSQTAAYGNLVPFIALLGGFLFLGEPLTWMQIAGGVLLIGGLMLLRHTRRTPPPMKEASSKTRGAEEQLETAAQL